MSNGYQEDMDMYEESHGKPGRQLGREALLRPIRDLDYPHSPVSFPPEALVGEVLDVMADKRFGAVLIVKDGKLIGIFAERDLLIKKIYGGKDLARPVSDFMTPDPDCLTPDDPIAYALNRMVQGGYRHVPLITPDRTPVGLLAMRDVVRYVESFFPAVVTNLPPHSEHNPPDRSPWGG